MKEKKYESGLSTGKRVSQVFRLVLSAAILFTFHYSLNNTVNAQDVTVTLIRKTNNLPIQTSAYIDNFTNYFSIMLTNNTPTTQSVYLTLNLECTYSASSEPFQIRTDDKRTTRPRIDIPGNSTYNFNTRQKFEDHFSGRLSTNVTQNTLNEMLRLPEGNYSMCVNVCRWSSSVPVGSDNVISTDCPMFEICYTGSAPEFNLPLANLQPMPGVAGRGGANVVIPARNLNFRWTGVITNCPQNARFDYIFKIVKVLPNQNVNDAINRNNVLYSYNSGTRTYCSIDTLRDLNVRF